MPLVAFGSQHTIILALIQIKRKDFMSSVILIPLFTIIPISLLVIEFHDLIGEFFQFKILLLSPMSGLFFSCFATSYFEVFYSGLESSLNLYLETS